MGRRARRVFRIDPRRIFMFVVLQALLAWSAEAQTNLQVWGDLSFNWVKSNGVSWALDLEPQAMLAPTEETPGWRSFSATPNLEYSAKNWLDLITEVGTGFTHQNDGLDSFELTPRAGIRLYLFSRRVRSVAGQLVGRLVPGERPSRRRLVVRDRFLVEERNLFYNQDQPTSSTVRLRNRLELQFVLNRENTTDDGSRTLLVDWEWFMPLANAEERFSNRQRVRAGFLFRRSFDWRMELVYVWTKSRDTIDQPFSTSDNAVSFTVRRFFRR